LYETARLCSSCYICSNYFYYLSCQKNTINGANEDNGSFNSCKFFI
jgi:hypothetical protein